MKRDTPTVLAFGHGTDLPFPRSPFESAPAVRQHVPGPHPEVRHRNEAAVKATQSPPPPPVNWDARCKLAASILNQREPSWLTAHVAHMALNGAGIDRIRAEQDRLAMMLGGVA